MTLPIDQIVVELNNMGVGFQEANRLDEALSIYRDAAHAMSGFLDVSQNETDGHEEQQIFCERWRAKLVEWSEKAQGGTNSCNDVSVPTMTFNLHAVAPYGQETSSFTKAHRIDINEVSKELASVIIIYNMALINSRKGALQESLKLFQLTLSLIPSEFDHMSTMALACIAAKYNLGLLLNKLDRRNDALEVLAGAADMAGALLGDHVLVINTLNVLGQLLIEEGKGWQAMEAFHLVALIYDRYDIRTAELDSQKDSMDNLAPAA